MAICGVLSALAVVLLLLGSLLPGYAIPAAAVAGLVTAAAVIRSGWGAGLSVYCTVSFLGLLLLPQKQAALWYLVIFGHYGVVKSVFERINSRALEWLLKCMIYTAAFFVMKLVFGRSFLALSELIPLPLPALYAVGLAAFLLYDIGFSRLIGLYLRRFCRISGKEV